MGPSPASPSDIINMVVTVSTIAIVVSRNGYGRHRINHSHSSIQEWVLPLPYQPSPWQYPEMGITVTISTITTAMSTRKLTLGQANC